MNAHVPVDCGFVRVPYSYLELPVSPGAMSLILHLCRAANDEGESYYSYEKIALIIGRSKGSISAYVKELVDLGIVHSTVTRTKNGYNSFRKLKLVQWASFVAYWEELKENKKSTKNKKKSDVTEKKQGVSSVTHDVQKSTPKSASSTPVSPSSKTECRIQPTECKDPSGPINYIQLNKTPGADAPVVWSSKDEEAWKRFRPDDDGPLSVSSGLPEPELIAKLEQVEQRLTTQLGRWSLAEAKEAAKGQLRAFAQKHGLKSDLEALSTASDALGEIAQSPPALHAAIEALDALWKPYWRQLPTPGQIKLSLTDAARKAGPSGNALSELSKFRKRLWFANLKARPQRQVA
jgi:hypothetical protein